MGIAERIRQKETATASMERELKSLQEAERLEKEAVEKEWHARRNQQAENFREESGVGIQVAELGAYLATPTIPITYDNSESTQYKYIGRGSSSRGLDRDIKLTPRDPDSAFDSVVWDYKCLGFSGMGWGHHSRKFIVVETCPDGIIIFHAGRWMGSTTIQTKKWRGQDDRRDIFEEALEKAYDNPGIMKFDSMHEDNTFG